MPSQPQTTPAQVLRQSRPDGSLYVVTGASRTGKTTWVEHRTHDARRVLVWDSADEWNWRFRCRRVESVFELAQAVKPGAPDARLAFCAPVTAENFAAFCRLAWVFIRVRQGTLIVEELADVTTPGKAPTYWGEIIRKGLRYGPEIYALTQRPSESDKTVFGNASVLHVHQMDRVEDGKYMARELRVEASLMDALKPYHWIERDRRTKALTNGMVSKRRARK
jgi:hypothetical protein